LRALSQRHEQRSLFRPAPVRSLDDTARLRVTPRHYAYLKISEGCDRLCTFCAIPGMRGKHVTKPIEEVLKEARELAADGVRELIVVAQDTTYYGLDLYGRVRLAELLRELDRVEGLEWVRVLYAYPIHLDDELIDTLAGAQKVLPYLDLPLQHINDRLLRRMQRKVDRRGTEELLARWPGLSSDRKAGTRPAAAYLQHEEDEMAFIRTIPPSDAEGPVRDMYEKARSRFGYVPNLTRAFSLRPGVMDAWAALLRSIQSNLPVRSYELATLAAARALDVVVVKAARLGGLRPHYDLAALSQDPVSQKHKWLVAKICGEPFLFGPQSVRVLEGGA